MLVLVNDSDPDGDALTLSVVEPLPPGVEVRVDAPGVPVSVQSISGAPENVTTSFAGLLGEAAAERKMEIVPGNKPARFRVKGYLTAQPTEDGQTALAFVWDVYDSTKQRAQRVQGESIGKRSGGFDPWAGIDQTIVAKAASDSMDAIAGFLVTAPGVGTLAIEEKATKSVRPGTRVAATDDKKKS